MKDPPGHRDEGLHFVTGKEASHRSPADLLKKDPANEPADCEVRKLAGRGEDADGDGHVVGGAVLGQVRPERTMGYGVWGMVAL
jgi:hypothetical protein